MRAPAPGTAAGAVGGVADGAAGADGEDATGGGAGMGSPSRGSGRLVPGTHAEPFQ
ncbi:hypothetical protein SCA03_54220 [Streptomyces cacaoi]|uniref:Uncharacterized protein n=1 Tax=Streptomyces cacaoi TaxID=1898 RepID=A0A4Y3R5E0_STRCI|nr:hypothetical protein SCA03_54220 [Streptomyces cacaoi]